MVLLENRRSRLPGRTAGARRSAALFLALLLLSAMAAGAQAKPQGLQLALSDADLSVTLQPGASRQLRAFREVEGQRVEMQLEVLETRLDDQPYLRLQRPAESPGRAFVELTLDPATPLAIEGDRLALTLTDLRGPSTTAATTKPVQPLFRPAGPAVRLTIGASTARLADARNLDVNATDSDLRLERTSDLLVAGLRGGSLTVAGHLGQLVLLGEGASLRVEDISGWYDATLHDGDLTARAWSGKGDVTLENSGFDLAGLAGELQVRGEASGLAIRQVEAKRIDLRGSDLQATIEATAGPLTAVLEGGALRLDGYRGEARIGGDGTAFESDGGGGALVLTLHNGSEAAVIDFAGSLRADMADSTLDVEGLESFAFTAHGGRVAGRRIGRLNRVTAKDTELDLDLAGVSKLAAMYLESATRARVALPAPCVVRTLGRQGLPGEAAEVTGCDLEVPDQAPTRLHAKRRYGGQAIVLNVEVGEGAELTVEGR